MMSDRELESSTPIEPNLGPRAFLAEDWPYLSMLALGLAGVVFTSVAREAARVYWVMLVPIFAAICVFTRWREIEHRGRWESIGIEALHWGAVLSTMYLLSVADAGHAMSTVASALALLAVFALGTFTAGLHIGAWRICIVGVVLALGVPVVAWLSETSLLITLVVLVVIAVGAMLHLHNARKNREGAERNLRKPTQS
jgi:4-amino-4-deoxy-L-arabinose transferase-like glycosyltransferase